MNAWEEGNRRIVDVLQCEQPPLFSHLMLRRPTSTSRMPGRPRDFFRFVRHSCWFGVRNPPRERARLKKAVIAQLKSVS
jgi:hypothetical protein